MYICMYYACMYVRIYTYNGGSPTRDGTTHSRLDLVTSNINHENAPQASLVLLKQFLGWGSLFPGDSQLTQSNKRSEDITCEFCLHCTLLGCVCSFTFQQNEKDVSNIWLCQEIPRRHNVCKKEMNNVSATLINYKSQSTFLPFVYFVYFELSSDHICLYHK